MSRSADDPMTGRNQPRHEMSTQGAPRGASNEDAHVCYAYMHRSSPSWDIDVGHGLVANDDKRNDDRHQPPSDMASAVTEAIIADIELHQAPAKRRDVLLRHAFGDAADLEVGMRAWADNSKIAAHALRQVDNRRRKYIRKLLRDLGMPAPLAAVRSTVLYWAYIGAAASHNKLSGRDLDQIVAQLMWFARP